MRRLFDIGFGVLLIPIVVPLGDPLKLEPDLIAMPMHVPLGTLEMTYTS